ncbi:nuclear transport factor 2 family protein [uncultured Ferrimonas sp.]|uniref:nuclear transport factor 2 family protein n=1 Tax=uncultured Ferrimonas sp. TaxID=432640 RepID=UPI00263495B7|nr:nuclear transport factor 2 family protein [uncultured Ferrimonas sp.]
MNHHNLIAAVEQASQAWQDAFNRGDAAACAAQYVATATMDARPFGHYQGHAQIQGFWQQLIEQGFAEVAYQQVQLDVIDAKHAVLSANWTMNNASGQIQRELWQLQADGSAKLVEDEFSANA